MATHIYYCATGGTYLHVSVVRAIVVGEEGSANSPVDDVNSVSVVYTYSADALVAKYPRRGNSGATGTYVSGVVVEPSAVKYY